MKSVKILFLTSVILLCFSKISFAGMDAEIGGMYMKGGGTGEMYGASGGLSFSVNSIWGVVFRGFYAVSDENSRISGIDIDVEYSRYGGFAGAEFFIPLQVLNSNRIKWKNSLCGGYSVTRTTASYPGDSVSVSDGGFALLAGTGLQYVFTQHISPFFEADWMFSPYRDDMKDYGKNSFQLNLGIRFSFSNTRRFGPDYLY